MNRQTERGLIVSAVGFFSSIFFGVLAAVGAGTACCLIDMIGLFGLILIYIGRFDHGKSHQTFAKYAIIIYIVVNLGILFFNFTEPGVLEVTLISGVQIALLMLVAFLMAFKLVDSTGKQLLALGLVLGVVGAGTLTFMSMPINQENDDIQSELEKFIDDKDERSDAMLSPSVIKKDYKNDIKENEINDTESYQRLNRLYMEWRNQTDLNHSAYTITIAALADINSTLYELNTSLKEPGHSTKDENLTLELLNITINIKKDVINNNRDYWNKTNAIRLLKDYLDNAEEMNMVLLAKAPGLLFFGFAYLRCYKRTKKYNDEQELLMKQERQRLLEEQALADKDDELEDDEEEEDPRPDDRKKGTAKGSKKKSGEKKKTSRPVEDDDELDDIMNISEIKKKYSN